MKARLLFADEDRGYPEPIAEGTNNLQRDLGTSVVLDAMACGNAQLREVAARVLLSPPLTAEQVTYRQDVLEDCLQAPDAVRELYELASTAHKAKQRVRTWMVTHHPHAVLHASVAILRDLIEYLQRLHAFALAHRGQFHSRGLVTLLRTIERDLGDDYLAQVRHCMSQLDFNRGVVLTARLGPGCTGIDYSLRDVPPATWWDRVTEALGPQHGYTYHLPPRDDHGGATMDRIRDHGLNTVADAAGQSADHVLDFFARLAFEVGFYLSCINLYADLRRIGAPVCRPMVEPPQRQALTALDLVDVGLALRTGSRPVGSDVVADQKPLVMMTGANQGGKSTLLRAVGLAQLMFDAGMFVTAEDFRCSPSAGVFTHYRREEDDSLEHGKFDDELARMSQLVDRLQPNALLLLDESFSGTNELEGSQIAHEVVDAIVDSGVRIWFVTHLYTLSRNIAAAHDPRHLFLRAERRSDGRRSYRLVVGEPESTSYAADQFHEVFGTSPR